MPPAQLFNQRPMSPEEFRAFLNSNENVAPIGQQGRIDTPNLLAPPLPDGVGPVTPARQVPSPTMNGSPLERAMEEFGSFGQGVLNSIGNYASLPQRFVENLTAAPPGMTRNVATANRPNQPVPPNPPSLRGMPPIADLAAQVNPPSPQSATGSTGSASPRTGWWAGRPEFNAGPSVLDIWNGSTGTGYDAQGQSTTPASGLPLFPGVNEQRWANGIRDFQISNPSNAPLGTFTAGPQDTNDPIVRREMLAVPHPIGSPQYAAALAAAEARATERFIQQQSTPQQLAAQNAQLQQNIQMGYTPPGGTPVPGAIQNAAHLALATPSGPQASYIAGRRHLTEQLERNNLSPQQIQAHLRANGYGPITLGGPELPDVTADVNASLTPLDRAVSALLPINPQTGATIGTAPRAFDATSRPLYIGALTDLFTRTPDNELTSEFLDRARQRISPTAFQAWLDTPSWQVGGWLRDPIPLGIQQARVRASLARRTQAPGGPLITNGGPLR